jgi:hypothetical protein
MSPGQWRDPDDKTTGKDRELLRSSSIVNTC